MSRARFGWWLGLLLVLGACADDPTGRAGGSAAPATAAYVDSAVGLRTTACGDTSKTTGSGVVVEPGVIATAAHVVIGAAEVTITTVDGEHSAELLDLDQTKDLALLRAPGVRDLAPAMLSDAAAQPGEPVTVIGASSGVVATELGTRLTLRVDDVRATTRSQRDGWDLPTRLAPGDSGAAVFRADGTVAAIIFSATADRAGRSFALDVSELRRFLDAADSLSWHCDPTLSRQLPDTTTPPDPANS